MLIVKFGETFLKSKSTKKKFINLLIENLKQKGVNNIKFKNAYLEITNDISPKIVANTFGVYKVEKIDKYDFPEDFDLDNLSDEEYAEFILSLIFEKIKEKYSNILSSKLKFRISVTRENKSFFLNSIQIQTFLGKKIESEFNAIATYKNFDFEIKIRILKDSFWLWSNKDEINGLGGLPYGIEGKALSLFSGGIDSPVATFLAAKRGIRQDFLFLNIPDSDFLLQQNFSIYKFLQDEYGIYGKFYELKAKGYIEKIKEKVPEGLRQIIFKIFLYEVSNVFADYLKLPAIINGENLGQVSTQTLTNMALLNEVSYKLTIRPLICFDKVEIIDLAKKIGTYDLSIQIKETCSLEKHSNSRIKNKQQIFDIYNSLEFNVREIVSQIRQVKSLKNIDFKKLRVDFPKGEVIDLDKVKHFSLQKDKVYTFICSSGYKASQQAYNWKNKGFNVFWTKK